MSDPLGVPYQSHSATSIAAAQSVRELAASNRQVVLKYLTLCGAFGSTDDEGEQALDMRSYRPRRVSLTNDLLVIDSGQTRLTRYGRKATVWVVAHGEELPDAGS